MTPELFLRSALWSLGTLAAVMLAFSWLAFHAARRLGGRGLVTAWLAGTAVITALLAVRIGAQQTALGVSAAQQARFPVVPMFLPWWAAAFGAVSLAVRAPARAGVVSYGPRLAGRSLLAGFGATLAFLLIVAAFDATGLLSWGR